MSQPHKCANATTLTYHITFQSEPNKYDWLDFKELDIRREYQQLPDEERERIVALYMRGYLDGYGDGY